MEKIRTSTSKLCTATISAVSLYVWKTRPPCRPFSAVGNVASVSMKKRFVAVVSIRKQRGRSLADICGAGKKKAKQPNSWKWPIMACSRGVNVSQSIGAHTTRKLIRRIKKMWHLTDFEVVNSFSRIRKAKEKSWRSTEKLQESGRMWKVSESG